jgi:hypothetical protein
VGSTKSPGAILNDRAATVRDRSQRGGAQGCAE